MREAFDDDDEFEKKDTEITLGLPSLLGIFFGLVLICGIFFGFGYSLGRGSSHSNNADNPSAAVPASTPVSSPVSGMDSSGSLPKPSAQQAAPPPSATTDGTTAMASPAAMTTTPGQPAGTVVESTAAVTQPGARTVPAAAPVAKPVVNTFPPPTVRPATPPAQFMVQIAAVRNPADASVLVSALQQRGYQVVARFMPQDSLTHVQIGPFTTRDAANRMRQRLEADGYNAILKP